ncbi:MAG: hypothetical protein M3Q54_03985 [Actinomycetota bacterium]|nr:hypothetical protein [Actinomycetota bacterium]
MDLTEARRNTFPVFLIGVSSGLLYLIVYLTQRGMFLNGRGESPVDGARLLFEAGGYYGATVLLFALYVWIIFLCRGGLIHDDRARMLALLFPVLFNLGLLFGNPQQSIDALTYVAHGYLGNLPDANPYTTAAAMVEGTSFGEQLASFGWLPVHGPSPYGPLWTHIEVFAFAISGSAAAALLTVKALVVAASLGSAALIWKILGRVRPEDQLLGTLVYLWNPVIVVEFAAEGHNDALMVLCVLLSLALTVSARPALSIVALMLGVLVKYLPLMLLPAQAIYLWRTERNRSRLAGSLFLGLVIGLVLTVAPYSPFWSGFRTLDAVRFQGQPAVSPSPSGLLYSYLLRSFPPEEAARFALLILGVLFVEFVLILSWRIRGSEGLLRACAGIALVYVLVASAEYWPWYTAFPLALLALAPRGICLFAAVAISLCSRLVAPVSVFYTRGIVSVDTAVIFKMAVGVTLPLAMVLILYLWQWRRRGESVKE